jgi:ABC-type lipoprotein export system ATPase subunit
MEALRAESLSKSYGAGATEVRALRDVSLTLARGEVVALVGPSGAGKSTLLLALGLLELPEKGRLWLDGRLVAEDGRAREDLSALRRDKLGFVFQKSNLIPFLTAEENVRIALEIGGGRDKANRERARALLADLEIADRADHYPDQLSGGQQQRVAIAPRARRFAGAAAGRRADRGARQQALQRRDAPLPPGGPRARRRGGGGHPRPPRARRLRRALRDGGRGAAAHHRHRAGAGRRGLKAPRCAARSRRGARRWPAFVGSCGEAPQPWESGTPPAVPGSQAVSRHPFHTKGRTP